MLNFLLNIAQTYTIPASKSQLSGFIATLVMIAGPFVGTFMFVRSSNKLFGAAMGAVSKAGAGARKAAMGWAKGRQEGSAFGRARAWSKSVREANRVEKQGKMTGPRGLYNKGMSLVAGAGSTNDIRKWGANAGKYQASAVNRAAIYDDKIHKEDKENAAAEFARNGIQGPLMVAHARSGRVARFDKDGKLEYGRKLTEAEHSAAIDWTMSQGKLEERMSLYGSDWASTPRNPENRRALDALTLGYFQKDVSRFGNTYGGGLGAGKSGGDVGVSNAVLANMAQGKTSAEALLDNDMAQRLADVGSMTDTEMIDYVNNTKALSDVAAKLGGAKQFVDNFRTNAKTVTKYIYDTPELNSRIKPEYAGALDEVNKNTYDPDRVKRAADEHADRVSSAAGLPKTPQDKIEPVAGFNTIGQKT